MYENDLRKDLKKNRNRNKNKINADQRQSGIGNMMLHIFPRVLGLGFRLGFFYLGFKRRARKAGKIFEKELLAAGMDKQMARKLRDDYMQSSHIFHQIRKARTEH
jgi:hypothetical protein